jgi:hypothetical protein
MPEMGLETNDNEILPVCRDCFLELGHQPKDKWVRMLRPGETCQCPMEVCSHDSFRPNGLPPQS